MASGSAGLLATVRSRCQKVAFRQEPPDPLSDPENRDLVGRLARVGNTSTPDLLDWAEEYRGARAPAAEEVLRLLTTASAWLRARVSASAAGPTGDALRDALVHRELVACRKALVQRNANPQMVAERALLTLREAAAG